MAASRRLLALSAQPPAHRVEYLGYGAGDPSPARLCSTGPEARVRSPGRTRPRMAPGRLAGRLAGSRDAPDGLEMEWYGLIAIAEPGRRTGETAAQRRRLGATCGVGKRRLCHWRGALRSTRSSRAAGFRRCIPARGWIFVADPAR